MLYWQEGDYVILAGGCLCYIGRRVTMLYWQDGVEPGRFVVLATAGGGTLDVEERVAETDYGQLLSE